MKQKNEEAVAVLAVPSSTDNGDTGRLVLCQRDAQGCWSLREGPSPREERMSMLRLQGEAGVRQVRGMSEACPGRGSLCSLGDSGQQAATPNPKDSWEHGPREKQGWARP